MQRSWGLVLLVVAACGDGETIEGDASVTPVPSTIQAPASLTLVEGETTTFSVTLSDPPSEGVVVNVSSVDAEAAAVTPSLIMFSPDRATADVTVTTREDDDDVINEMTDVVLSIENGDSRRVATRVIDNDVQQIVTDTTNVTVTESATTTFSVRLARQPSTTVTLSAWSDTPLIAAVNPATVTFDATSYSVAQTITVTGVLDNDTANGAAHVYVGQVPNVTDARVDVGVTDDDVQALVLSATNLPLTEGTSGTFMVSLAFDPLQPTDLQVQSSDLSAAMLGSASLLQFTSSNYNIPQTVTIVASEDSDEVNELVTFAVSGSPAGSVTVPVLDNDLIRVQSSTIFEGQTSPFYVRLADRPGIAGMTVSVAVLSGDVTVSPSSLVIPNGDYASSHPFYVTPSVDYTSNADRQATLRFSAPGQTSRDVTFTIDDRIPGSMNYVSVLNEYPSAGAIGYIEITLGVSNAWPADGRAVISFPPGFDASGATFVSSSVSGSYSIAATTSTVTVFRSNGWPDLGGIRLRLGNVRNPPVSGTYLIGAATKTGAGDPLDSGSGNDNIYSGPLSGANVTLGDTNPGATTTATFSFAGHNPWPADGKLAIYFPTVFDFSVVTVSSQSGVDGTITASVSGSLLTLTRSGGTTTPGNTPISITLANVVNPTPAQATGSFELATQTATGTWIDVGFTKGLVIGCPATMTKAPQRGSNVPFGGDAWNYPDGVTGPSWGTDVAYIQWLDESDYLVADNFQFTVPTGATVTGIRFNVERDFAGYNVVDSSVRVVKSTLGQTERASTALWTSQPVSYGDATDLWGETWTATDIESSTFGIAMAVRAAVSGMQSHVRVGYVTATVYLSCP